MVVKSTASRSSRFVNNMAAKNVLVYGGAGQLGAAVIDAFNGASWSTTAVDFRENPKATTSIVIGGSDVKEHVNTVSTKLKAANLSFDSVICVAGGWCGGDVKSDTIFAGVEKMWNFNVQSAVATSHLAANYLNANGLLILTGAAAATGPTPGMIAYGITKAATHHLVKSLSASGSGLPDGARVVAACPNTLDTATNRQGMPKANFSDWTPLSELANKFVGWSDGNDVPANGALIDVLTKGGQTTYNQI